MPNPHDPSLDSSFRWHDKDDTLVIPADSVRPVIQVHSASVLTLSAQRVGAIVTT